MSILEMFIMTKNRYTQIAINMQPSHKEFWEKSKVRQRKYMEYVTIYHVKILCGSQKRHKSTEKLREMMNDIFMRGYLRGRERDAVFGIYLH